MNTDKTREQELENFAQQKTIYRLPNYKTLILSNLKRTLLLYMHFTRRIISTPETLYFYIKKLRTIMIELVPMQDKIKKPSTKEVDVWIINTEEINPQNLLENSKKILSESEIKKSETFYFKKHKHQYLATRIFIRSICSIYV